jgi:heme exporter protein A
MPHMLTVSQLGLKRSERWLVRDLSFAMGPGDVIQVTGSNGAGKTTLLRCLCGFMEPATGTFRWHMPSEADLPLFLGHKPAVKPELTVLENITLHPLSCSFVHEKSAIEALARVGLSAYLDTPARHLSAGQTRRVALSRLLLSSASVWVLDEPFTALDVEGCGWLSRCISDFSRKGGAVLMTSHQPVEVDVPVRQLPLERPPC